jgi:hypothetical protein
LGAFFAPNGVEGPAVALRKSRKELRTQDTSIYAPSIHRNRTSIVSLKSIQSEIHHAQRPQSKATTISTNFNQWKGIADETGVSL